MVAGQPGGYTSASTRYPSRSRSASKAAASGRVSFDTGGTINVPQRRAQSSLRPSRYVAPNMGTSQQQQQYQTGHSSTLNAQHNRPRPVSAGRLMQRNDYLVEDDMDDPDVVTKAILELRGQREKRSSSRGNADTRSRQHGSAGSSPNENKPSHMQDRSPMRKASPVRSQSVGKAPLPHSLSGGKVQEHRASAQLQEAEEKIDGLLEELEELRFFQELDQASPSPPAAQKRLGASKPSVRPQKLSHGPQVVLQPLQSMQSPARNGSQKPKTPRGDQVPPVIRAPSPARAVNMLPPPPPSSETLTTTLSPRQISRMDRTSLELETQKLVRRVEVLLQERTTLESAVTMYEITLQDQTHTNERTNSLEEELRKVSGQLKAAKGEMKGMKQSLMDEFADQMKEALEELETSQNEMQQYKDERDQLRKDLDKQQKEYTEKFETWKAEIDKERDSYKSREAVLELQLDETKANIEELQSQIAERDLDLDRAREEMEEKLAERQDQIDALGQKLTEAEQLVIATKEGRDEHYEKRISDLQKEMEVALETHTRTMEEKESDFAKSKEDFESRLSSIQEELSHTEDKYTTAFEEKEELSKKLEEKENQSVEASNKSAELAEQLEEARQKLEDVHVEYRAKLQDLKTSYENKERRRLDEIVATQSAETKEFERRLKSLQEQLGHANSRSQARLEQQEKDFQERWDSQVSSIRRNLEAEVTERLRLLEKELKAARRDFEHADAEKHRYRMEAEAAPSQDLIEEYERREKSYQDEISDLKTSAERLMRGMDEKESQIRELSKRLSDVKSQHTSAIEELEAKGSQERLNLEEQMAIQRKHMRVAEVKLRSELTQRENELQQLTASTDARVAELQAELECAKDELKEAKKAALRADHAEGRVQELQAENDKLMNERLADQSKTEGSMSELRVEISVLEGKLRASELNVQQKRAALEKLEEEFRDSTEESTTSNKNLQRELDRLRSELEEMKDEMDQKVTELEAKSDFIGRLQLEAKTTRKKADRVEELEETISKLQKSVADAEDEKISKVVELNKLQNDYKQLVERLSHYEEKAEETTHLTYELQLRETQANHISEQYSQTVKELQDKIAEERKAKNKLIERLGDTEAELELKEHQLSRLPKLQSQLKEMIRGREEMQEHIGRVEAELQRKERQVNQSTARYTQSMEDFKEKLDHYKAERDDLLSQKEKLQQDLDTKLQKANRQIPELQAQLQEQTAKNDDLQSKLERSETENRQIRELEVQLEDQTTQNDELRRKLERCEAEISRQRQKLEDADGDFSIELQTKVEQLTRSKATLEARLQGMEEEVEDREKQVSEASERYSNQIIDLQMKVDELSKARDSLRSKLSQVQAELDNKVELISSTSSQYSGDVSDLQGKVNEQRAEKYELQARIESLEEKLAEKERELKTSGQMIDQELQDRLDAETKEKRSLRLKIFDIEAQIELKDKQMKDVVDRYTRDISDLEERLEDQIKTKGALKREIEVLKNDAASLSGVSTEASYLKEQISTMEKTLDIERTRARDADRAKKRLEEKMSDIEHEREDLEERLKKVSSERAEVISALEEVIHEVQNREDEVESLANTLRKRDQDLEHAKLIATKALASAQEIKAHYQERESEHGDGLERLSELNTKVGYLTSRNEALQRKTSQLEKELRQKEHECSNLRSQIFGNDGEEKSDKMDQIAMAKPLDEDDGFGHLSKGFADFGSPKAIDNSSKVGDANENMSVTSGDFGETSAWFQDFDTISTDSGNQSFNHSQSEQSHDATSQQSRRSIERDALRKYVRKRYLKTKS